MPCYIMKDGETVGIISEMNVEQLRPITSYQPIFSLDNYKEPVYIQGRRSDSEIKIKCTRAVFSYDNLLQLRGEQPDVNAYFDNSTFDIVFEENDEVVVEYKDCYICNYNIELYDHNCSLIMENVEFITSVKTSNPIEIPVPGYVLLIANSTGVIGYVDSFKKMKMQEHKTRGTCVTDYNLICKDLTIDLKYLDDDSEMLLLEEGGEGLGLSIILGEKKDPLLRPEDCLGSNIDAGQLYLYLVKYQVSELSPNTKWISDKYILRAGRFVSESASFVWTEKHYGSQGSNKRTKSIWQDKSFVKMVDDLD